jgi:hypothetical protein
MVILVGLYDENPQINPNAAKLDGDVKILMQKGRDQASAKAIALNGVELIAEVRNGEWRSQPIGLEAFANEGFDTMVAEFQGQRVFKNLIQQPNNQAATRSQVRLQQQAKIAIEVTALDVVPKDDGKKCDVVIFGIVTNNNAPVTDAQLDLFYQGRIETQCQISPGIKSDDNGRFSYTFADRPADGKRVKLEIQIRGGYRRPVEVEIPAAPKEKEQIKPEQRFVLGIEDDNVPAIKFTCVIPMTTLDKNGKVYSSTVQARIVKGHHSTFFDGNTGANLAQSALFCETVSGADGKLYLGVKFTRQLKITVELSHPDSKQKRQLTLVYKQW